MKIRRRPCVSLMFHDLIKTTEIENGRERDLRNEQTRHFMIGFYGFHSRAT